MLGDKVLACFIHLEHIHQESLEHKRLLKGHLCLIEVRNINFHCKICNYLNQKVKNNIYKKQSRDNMCYLLYLQSIILHNQHYKNLRLILRLVWGILLHRYILNKHFDSLVQCNRCIYNSRVNKLNWLHLNRIPYRNLERIVHEHNFLHLSQLV